MAVAPGVVLGLLLVLALSHLFYAFWPYRHRGYLAVLLLTAAGVLLGQGWDVAGLPGLRLGEANVVPAILFAAGLQPLARPLRLPWRP